MPCHVAFLALVLSSAAQSGALRGNPADGDPLWVEVREPGSQPPSAADSASTAMPGVMLSQDVLSTGPAPEGDQASAAAFTPDGARFVVAHRFSRNLIVWDAATQAFAGEVPLSGSPNDVAITPDGARAVTANFFEDSLSIVDLASLTEVATVPVGGQPAAVAVTPGGLSAVVANTLDQTLSVVDLASATETHRIAGAGFVLTTSIAFEPGTITNTSSRFVLASDTLAIAPDFWNDEIDFFDLAAGTVRSVPSAIDPRGIAITPDGSTALVAHTGTARTLTVVDTATQAITKTIPTGIDLWGPVAIKADGSWAVAAVQNAVVRVDLTTGQVFPQLSTASVDGLLPTADGKWVLAVGFQGALIDWNSNSIVKALNNTVSTPVGAASPTDTRAVLVANLFGEDMLVVDTNGAAGAILSHQMSGPDPEGDATRKVAITPDGTRAVTTNILSDTASILDLASGAIVATVGVGDRPADVAVTPDGSLAVVANLDSTFASVIDLSTFAVSNVPISTRAAQVEISPNGQYAYLAVVSGGDGIWRIDLGTLSVAGPKLFAGNMGSIFFLFQQASGMTLSHDGSTLVSCGSFDDTITIVDTASWSVVATVGVGSFPVRAVFSADDGTIYVSCRDSDQVAEVTNAGAASALTRLMAVGDGPFEMAPAADGSALYVGNFNAKTISSVDLSTGAVTAVTALADAPQGLHLSADGASLLAASGSWSVALGPFNKVAINSSGVFELADVATAVVTQQAQDSNPPAMLALNASETTALVPSPFADGLVRTAIQSPPLIYCTAKPSSAGCVTAIGTSDPLAQPVSGAGDYSVLASSVQGIKNGIFFFSLSGAATLPFSGGILCMNPPLGRTPIQFSFGSGPSACDGAFSLVVNDGVSLHDPGPGNSVWLQAWYRDPANGPGNLGTALSDAVQLDY